MESGLLVKAYRMALEKVAWSADINYQDLTASILLNGDVITIEQDYYNELYTIKYKTLKEGISIQVYCELRDLTFEKLNNLRQKQIAQQTDKDTQELLDFIHKQ
jgi:hypothetical protein